MLFQNQQYTNSRFQICVFTINQCSTLSMRCIHCIHSYIIHVHDILMRECVFELIYHPHGYVPVYRDGFYCNWSNMKNSQLNHKHDIQFHTKWIINVSCIYTCGICKETAALIEHNWAGFHNHSSLWVEYWHRVREVTGSIPSQGPRHTKDVITMVPGSSLV